MALIEAEKLVKIYGLGEISIKALDGVTLSVEKGEFLVLAGRSGSGKTTLLSRGASQSCWSPGRIGQVACAQKRVIGHVPRFSGIEQEEEVPKYHDPNN